MKKFLHVLFLITAISLTFTACSSQVDEATDEETEEVKQPKAKPDPKSPQGQKTDPDDSQDPDSEQDSESTQIFDRFKFEQILITRTQGINEPEDKPAKFNETALDDFIKKPVKTYVNSAGPEPYYVACTLTFGGGEPLECQVKVRGNWTTSYKKKSLRIKFTEKQNILGLHNGEKYKNWVLLAGFKDASFLRDAVGFTMFKTMFPDYYCSDFKLVEVLLKTADHEEPENLGVYLLAEQQEGKAGRINITEGKKKEAENTNIGYIIEFDNYAKHEEENQKFSIKYLNNNENLLTYNGKTAGGFIKDYTIKNDMYSATQKNFISNYMNNLWRICYEAAYNEKYYRFSSSYTLEEYTPDGDSDDERAQNCVEQVIDLTSLVNTYIFSEITCDPDLYYSSFYMDIDFSQGDHRLRFEAPWDFDSTMGNKRFCSLSDDNFNDNSKSTPFSISSIYAGNGQPDVNGSYSDGIRVNPWLVVFIRSAWFQQLVKDQWHTIETANLKSEINNVIDSYTNSEDYAKAFNDTRSKWGWYKEDELNSVTLSKANSSQAEAAQYLKEWLVKRIDALDSIINELQPQTN